MPGTYASIRYELGDVQQLIEFGKKHSIPHLVKQSNVHSTIIFSREHLPDLPIGCHDVSSLNLTAVPIHFDVWSTRPVIGQDPSNVLVLALHSPSIIAYHDELSKIHKAIYDFDNYTPHIALSYDIGDFQYFNLQSHIDELEKLDVVSMHVEPLDLERAIQQMKEEDD